MVCAVPPHCLLEGLLPTLLALPLQPASFTPLADVREDGFNQARKATFLEVLKRTKGNLAQAAEVVGIHFSTVYNHVQADPVFRANVEIVKRHLAGKLVKSAYTVGARPEASGHADRKMLLRAWLPEEFGDKPAVAITFDLSSLTQQNGATIPGLSVTETPNE